ncbi:MAG: hypothetical protein R3C11_08885 [Planctomycetaceae bacterium]
MTGSVVLSAYDKSVEYISGGSGVGDIKKFFWDFKRSHYPSTNSSWNHYTYSLYKRDEERMQQLGTFGGITEMATTGGARGTDHLILYSRVAAPMMMKRQMAESFYGDGRWSGDGCSGS